MALWFLSHVGLTPYVSTLHCLSRYILFTFFFIAFISAEVVTIEWVDQEYGLFTDRNSLLNILTYANVALWFLSHIGLTLFIKKHVIPREMTKATKLQSGICSLSGDKKAPGAMH